MNGAVKHQRRAKLQSKSKDELRLSGAVIVERLDVGAWRFGSYAFARRISRVALTNVAASAAVPIVIRK